MNSLPDAAKATLYNLDCTYLTDVQYNRESLDTVTLNFFEEPFRQFPQKFFLMPEGNAYDYRAFIYTLTEDIHSAEKFPRICNLPGICHAKGTEKADTRYGKGHRDRRLSVCFKAGL